MRASSLPTELATVGALPVLRWPALDATGAVDALVTTRAGGVSEGVYESLNLAFDLGDDPDRVVENRSRAAAAVGLRLDDLVFAHQTHGRDVARVSTADRGRGARRADDEIADTDILVTTDADVGLVVKAADCVTLVLVDPDARVLACVHAGWRGTTGRAGAAAVDAMVAAGARPERVVAGIGPAIAADRYQVGDDVADAARAAFGERTHEVLRPDGTGRWLFDGPAANVLVLTDSGVPAASIHRSGFVTGTGELFSDRAARPCGRHAAIARLRPR